MSFLGITRMHVSHLFTVAYKYTLKAIAAAALP